MTVTRIRRWNNGAISKRLRLKINRKKSTVARSEEDTLLGYTITRHDGKPQLDPNSSIENRIQRVYRCGSDEPPLQDDYVHARLHALLGCLGNLKTTGSQDSQKSFRSSFRSSFHAPFLNQALSFRHDDLAYSLVQQRDQRLIQILKRNLVIRKQHVTNEDSKYLPTIFCLPYSLK
jgi:hypothetical protein